jgi:hypothetical protein
MKLKKINTNIIFIYENNKDIVTLLLEKVLKMVIKRLYIIKQDLDAFGGTVRLLLTMN